MANKTIVDLETDLVKPYIDNKAITIEKNFAPTENGATAVGSYAIGEQFVRGDKLYKAKTAITAGDTLTLNTNYELADDITTQVTSLKEDLADYKDRMGTLNLLQNTMSSYPSFSGVQIVVDSDGIISTQNTSTGLVAIAINSFTIDGNHKISGCPSGGSSASYCFQLKENDTYLNVFDTGSGVEYDFDGTKTYALVLVIRSGVNTNGLVFKPMITTADTPNSDYAHFVPYSKTNRQLTEDSVDWNDLSQVGAVNLFEYPYANEYSTSSGITFADIGDGSITVGTGTVSSSAAAIFIYADSTWIKKYAGKALKLSSIASSDALGNNLILQGNIQDSNNNILTSFNEVLGTNGVDIILTIPSNAAKIYCQLYIAKNTVISSAFTVKLMLTPVSYNGAYVPYAKTNKELTDDVADLSNSKQSKLTNGYGTAIAWDIVLSGGHGGVNGSRALIICQGGLAQLGFWGGTWQLAWSNLSGSSTVSASNQSASGIRLTFNDNSSMDVTPLYDCEVVSITPVS